MAFYTCASVCHTKATLPYHFKAINTYIDSLMYISHTYQVSFHSMVWCVYTGTADSNFVGTNKIKFHFLFRILPKALIRECGYLYVYFDPL